MTAAEGTRLHKRASSAEDGEAAAESRGQILDGSGAFPPNTFQEPTKPKASFSGRSPQHQWATRGASPFFAREPQRIGAWSHAVDASGKMPENLPPAQK